MALLMEAKQVFVKNNGESVWYTTY